jgi:competence protein ComEC
MPLLWLSLAFLAGIIIADNAAQPTTTWLTLAGVALGLSLLFFFIQQIRVRRSYGVETSSTWIILTPLILLAITLGGIRYQSSLPDLSDPNFIASHNDRGERVSIIGIVDAFPDVRDTFIYLRVKTEDIRPYGTTTQHEPLYGMLLVKLDPGKYYRYGDRLLLHGFLETPSETQDFSYREYLARQGVYSYMSSGRAILIESDQGNPFWGVIYSIKEKALQMVYQLWPDPEASVLAGILLGVETGIPEAVAQAFKETGTSHIIAISGFNMAIVAALFVSVFGRLFGVHWGAFAAIIGLSLYTILVGGDPAVVRAAIMAGFALFARQVGRRQQALNTLAITAALMALINPQVPWDVGFQLSFAATLGLVLYARPMQDGFAILLSRRVSQEKARKVAGPVGEYVLFTIAAQITTLPIMAYHFGSISWVAFLANPAILPAQPPIMILGGLALILGMLWRPLGILTAPLAWPFVLYTIRVVEFFAQLPGGSIVLGDFSLMWVILFYTSLFGLTLGWQQIKEWLTGSRENLIQGIAIPVIVVLGVVTVLVWRMALNAPDGLLHLTILDVGSGDAILLRTPEGHSVLINGGPSSSRLSDGLGRRLPPFDKHLDWLIVAAPQQEQIAALPRTLDRFQPRKVMWAGLASPTREADYLRETLTNLNIQPVDTLPNQILDLGNGASLEVLTVSERGAILLLEWDRFRALLPLGADADSQESIGMGMAVGQVSVLLLAEQGYAPLNPPEWISNLRPQLTLLSVAADDPAGRPDREVLDALGGYSLLRTDQHGWIHIQTDGKQMWVQVERK